MRGFGFASHTQTSGNLETTQKKSIASYSRISPPNIADDGTRKHTWEIKFETDGRKPLMKNYTCTDDPTKENHFGINTGFIQEMVKNKNK